MKNSIMLLLFTVFMISCSNDNDTKTSIEINGEFTHKIKGCDNGGNFEINCVEFIDFINDSTVAVLIGGGDIVYRTNYQIFDNKIFFEQTGGLNFDISFTIIDETTLIRIEDGEVWKKE